MKKEAVYWGGQLTTLRFATRGTLGRKLSQ